MTWGCMLLCSYGMMKRSRPVSGSYRLLNSISSADSPCLGSPILHRSKTTVTQLAVHSDSDEVQEGVYRVERLLADRPCKSQKVKCI